MQTVAFLDFIIGEVHVIFLKVLNADSRACSPCMEKK